MAKGKSNSPVAEVRRATGQTAKEFARLVGISESLLKKIECGNRPLTADAAAKIARATGSDSTALVHGHAKTASGDPFSSESFAAHQTNLANGLWHSGIILSWLEVILEAAEKNECASQVKSKLVAFMGKTIREHRLNWEINKSLSKAPKEITQPLLGMTLH